MRPSAYVFYALLHYNLLYTYGYVSSSFCDEYFWCRRLINFLLLKFQWGLQRWIACFVVLTMHFKFMRIMWLTTWVSMCVKIHSWMSVRFLKNQGNMFYIVIPLCQREVHFFSFFKFPPPPLKPSFRFLNFAFYIKFL